MCQNLNSLLTRAKFVNDESLFTSLRERVQSNGGTIKIYNVLYT